MRQAYAFSVLMAVGACLGGVHARAGFVPLPTTLDQLTIAGNFTTVNASNQVQTYSNFS